MKRVIFLGKAGKVIADVAMMDVNLPGMKIFPEEETFTFAGVEGWKKTGMKFSDLCPVCSRVAGNVSLGERPDDPGAVYESWNCRNCKLQFETRINPEDATICWRKRNGN